MLGLEWPLVAILTASLVVGGVVKGVVALGLPMVSIAILLNFFPPLTVLGILVMPIIVTNLWQTVRLGNLQEPLRRFWPMIITGLVFLFIGAELIVGMDTGVLFGMLGACVAAFSAISLAHPNMPALQPKTEKWAGPLAGAMGGLLGGISTIWGPPMTMYFVMLKLPKDVFVRSVGMAWFAFSVPLAVAYWRNGIFSGDVVYLSLYACIPGMIGICIGEAIRERINQDTFRKVMLVMLLLVGLNLIRRAVF
ncbi:MAG: sulfite exporter TauE/SafE family protein [Rhodospirillales bacterium]|nr:sulfite exporter TauE/SafE family protein [Rhodospirillales bacterium]